MYLDVTFKDGTVSHCVLTQSHTIQIVNPLAQIQDAFSLDGVASIALNAQGNPAATDPTPPDFSGAAEGATPDPTVESPSPGTSDALSPDAASPAEESADPVLAAVPDPTPAEDLSNDSQTSEQTTPASSEAAPPGDEAAAPAADDPAATVAAAQAVAASDAPAPDKQAQIQTALADIEASLAEFPDSPGLLDAKAQLEALAGEITTA